MTVRLSINMRNTIRMRTISAAFDERREALQAEESALGMRLYEKAFPAELRARIAALPESWTSASQIVTFNFCGLTASFDLAASVPVPCRSGARSPLMAFADEALRDEFTALNDRQDALKQERSKADRALGVFLHSFSTLKQLQAGWPEGLPYFADLLVMAPSMLPALQSIEINQMLGLGVAA